MGRLSRYERQQLEREQREFRLGRARSRLAFGMEINRCYAEGLGVPATAKRLNCTRKKVEAWRRFLGLSLSTTALDLQGRRLSTPAGVDVLLAHEAAPDDREHVEPPPADLSS